MKCLHSSYFESDWIGFIAYKKSCLDLFFALYDCIRLDLDGIAHLRVTDVGRGDFDDYEIWEGTNVLE